MKTIKCLAALCLAFLFINTAQAQDYSNKGKDFWIGYGNHVRMFSPGQSEQMQLYITSDVNTTGQVEIASIGFSQSFSISANQITTIDIPRSAALMDDGLFAHGIHVTALKPVVVYSFIYFNAQSGATVCLPTNTLGQDYYSVNFTQVSNEAYSNSYFFVIAADTGKTTVEITPAAVTKTGKQAGVPFTVELQQGQIYQVLGAGSGSTGVDLTGSRIRSVNQGSGCKRIAVYCGSGKISIGCSSAVSSDNLYQQMYPLSTWGKKYITVNGLVNSNNYYRIIKSDPAAVVKKNGIIIPSSSFTNNFYYQYLSSQPDVIESDKPILVAQYFTSQGCAGNPGSNPGSDPEMIYLNPVEQTISQVTLNSMQPSLGTNITNHYLNVVLKNTPSAINTFKVDGIGYSNFTPVPNDNGYAFARIPTSRGSHNISCDTGFNIIAYGFGNAESYGYSGGTNLKDLYQYISIKNQYSTVSFPATCKGSPFNLSMVFPYQPTKIQWQFNGLFADTSIDNPAYDSTWVISGKQIYRYQLPSNYVVNNAGTYSIKVIAKNPTPDGCSGEQEINFDLQVYEAPKAAINVKATECLGNAIQFNDVTNANGMVINKWYWELEDGTTNVSKSFSQLFTTPGVKKIKLAVITDVGCISDTATGQVNVETLPVARFSTNGLPCLNKTVRFQDESATTSSAIVKWYWDFGDGSAPVVATTNAVQTHAYLKTGSFTATLKVENATGCQSEVFFKFINVTSNPVPDFTFGNACLPLGSVPFANKSSIDDGTHNELIYKWSFGDGNDATIKDPLYHFSATGPFSTKLIVTSNAGCTDSVTKTVNTIYAQPKAAFDADQLELCLGNTFTFTNKSSAANSSVIEWHWSLGDGTSATTKDISKSFTTARTYLVKLSVASQIGCASDTAEKTVIINPLPAAAFTVSNPSCEGVALSFKDASVANAGNIVKWNWNMGDGNTNTKTENQPFNYTYLSAKSYAVTLLVETDKGCISPLFSKMQMVNAMPVVGFEVPGSCITDLYSQFTDTSKIADGTQNQFSYLWNFGDVNASGSNLNTSSIKAPKHKFSVTGGYNVSLTVTSNNGCTASVTENFFVNGAVPQSAFEIVGKEHCSNNEVSIKNNSTVDVGRIVKMEIYWNYENDPTNKSVILYPNKGNVYSYKYPEFYSPLTKDYKIMVVAYSGENCLSTSFQTFTLNATPEISFAKIPSVCANILPYSLTQATLVNGLPGSGVFAGPGVSGNGLFNPALAGVGTHTIQYTFTAANSCSNFKEETVEVFPVPTVNAGPDIYLLEGDSVQLKGEGIGKNITYLWSPLVAINKTDIPNPYVSPIDNINYKLIVTSVDGCVAQDAVFVKVLKKPVIPNTFSPNGDGVHDQWTIPYIDAYPDATIEIYNRYGQLVFQSKGYSKPWDGNFNGKPAPVGTYYYLINPKSGRKQVSGFVDLIR